MDSTGSFQVGLPKKQLDMKVQKGGFEMKNKTKKAISLVMVVAVLLGLLPISAFAAEPAFDPIRRVEGGSDVAYFDVVEGADGIFGVDEITGRAENHVPGNMATVQEDITKILDNQFQIDLTVTTQQKAQAVTTKPDAAVVIVMDLSDTMVSECADCGRVEAPGFGVPDNSVVHQTFGYQCKNPGLNGLFRPSLDNLAPADADVNGKYPLDAVPADKYCANCNFRFQNHDTGNYLADHAFKSRLSVAKQTLMDFIKSYVENANGERYICLVTYAGKDDVHVVIEWTDAAATGSLDALNTQINDIKIHTWGTYTSDGMAAGYGQLNGEAVKSIENKSMILLTDGLPGRDDTPSDYGSFPDKYNEKFEELKALHTGNTANDWLYPAGWGFRVQGDNANMFSIGFGTGNKGLDWLDVFSTKAFDAKNAADLQEHFGAILEEIVTTAQGATVTVPLGEYMVYDAGAELNKTYDVAGKTAGGSPVSYDPTKHTLTWDLGKVQNPESSTVNDVTTYTYKLPFRVNLDTTKEGFSEDAWYATNLKTVLNYSIVTEVDDKPTTQPAEPLQFRVPMVRGKLPVVPYSVELVLRNAYTKIPVATHIVRGEAVRHSEIDLDSYKALNESDFSEVAQLAGYSFVGGSQGKLRLNGMTGNDAKLYFERETATVHVTYRGWETYQDEATGELLEKELDPQPTVLKNIYFKGDDFTTDLTGRDIDVARTEADETNKATVAKAGGSYEQLDELPAGDSYLVIHYKVDNRGEGTLTANYFGYTKQWLVNESTGKYELTTPTDLKTPLNIFMDEQSELTNIWELAGKKGDPYLVPTKSLETLPIGYALDEANTDMDALEGRLGGAISDVDVYFAKEDTKPQEGAEVTVIEHYMTRTLSGGNPVGDLKQDGDLMRLEDSPYAMGEFVKPIQDTVNYDRKEYAFSHMAGYAVDTNGGEHSYEADKDNANSNYSLKIEQDGTYTIDVYYERLEGSLTPATVTVTYYYHPYEVVVDPATGEVSERRMQDADGNEIQHEKEVTVIPPEGIVFYVDGTVVIPEDKTYDSITYETDHKDNKPGEQKITSENMNVVLIYELHPNLEEVETVQYTVTHKYTNYRTYLDENGVIQKGKAEDAGNLVEPDVHHGTPGDSWTVDAQTTPDDKGAFTWDAPAHRADETSKTYMLGDQDAEMIFNYSRPLNELNGKTAKLTIQPVYVTYSWKIEDGKVVSYIESMETDAAPAILQDSPESRLVPGQVIAIDPKMEGLAREHFDYSEALTTEANSGEKININAFQVGNREEDSADVTVTLYFARTKEKTEVLGNPVDITLDHHSSYQVLVIQEGELTTVTVEEPIVTRTFKGKFAGEYFDIIASEETPENYSLTKKMMNGTELLPESVVEEKYVVVGNSDMQLDYYYLKNGDPINRAEKTTIHLRYEYQLVDWDGTTLEGVYESIPDGDYYVDAKYEIPFYDFDGLLKKGEHTPVSITNNEKELDGMEATLEADENAIVVKFYMDNWDSRVDTSLKIVHQYFAQDKDNAGPIEPDGSDFVQMMNGVKDGAYVGASIGVALRLENQDKTGYVFQSATGTGDVSLVENTEKPGELESVTLTKDGMVITITYLRDTSVKDPGPGPGPGPDPGPGPGPDPTPTPPVITPGPDDEDDDDNDTPVVTPRPTPAPQVPVAPVTPQPPTEDEGLDIGNNDIPLGDMTVVVPPVEEEFIIVDEQSPLGNLPQTGTKDQKGSGLMGMLGLSGLMAAGGAMLLGRKKEDKG